MKRKNILLALFATVIICSGVSAQMEDNFGDLDFSRNPTWCGDTNQFRINTSQQLQLKSEGADTSCLSTQNTRIVNTEWRFWVKLSFNTSANNYARIYLASDQQNLKASLHGYFLQIGGGNDSLTFYKQNGVQSDKLFQGMITSTSNSTNSLRIKVLHDSAGTWRLSTDTSGVGNYIEEGNFHDDQIQTSGWFGVFCRFTSSNATKFYFDDFYIGPIQTDTTPPVVSVFNIVGPNQLEVVFSEAIEISNALNPANYQTVNTGSPSQVSADPSDSKRLTLRFDQNFADGAFDTLTIFEMIDLQGNRSPVIRIPFCQYDEKFLDIVISEVMADPDPAVGLPVCEYVELFNRTRYPINIKDWVFYYGVHSKKAPNITIDPHGFLILTQGDSLAGFGRCLEIFSSASSLSNGGSSLVLRDNSGKTIHSVCYSEDWYQSSFKEKGGWSLEMIDADNPCGCNENWSASTSPDGGTPGQINSVTASNPDSDPPYLKRARIIPDHQVDLFFSEPMDSLSLSGLDTWFIDHELGNPDSLVFFAPDYMQLRLCFRETFQKGVQYMIHCTDEPIDCAMNKIDTIKIGHAAIPDSVSSGDVVVNEILSNPFTGGERFVEAYNKSQKVISLKDLVISSFDSTNNTLSKMTEISESEYLFFPGEFLVLTRDAKDIRSRYYSPSPDVFLELESLPAYKEDVDWVVITRKQDGAIIDMVKYSKAMHFPLAVNTGGISLERINPFSSSAEQTNWHSASESCGFGTPGYKNSQYRKEDTEEGWVTIFPRIFSPDNDGRDDFLSIVIHPDIPGYYATVKVFDSKGRCVRNLAKNRLLSSVDSLVWDGVGDDQKTALAGIYILYVEFIHPGGKRKSIKSAFVLGGIF